MKRPSGISLKEVCKRYGTPANSVHALDGVSFTIEPAMSVAVTGPSGCGKSTLLGVIAGLETPTSGSVSVGGRTISDLAERERALIRRHEFGLVFQADNLLPYLTALENVAQQLSMQPRPEDGERSLAMLACLGLADESGRLPDQLSGGQRQRVALARALVHRPRLILADEPTGSLDAASSELVIDLLLTAQRETSTTLVVATHDADLARRLDRTIRLTDGRVVEGRTVPSVLDGKASGA